MNRNFEILYLLLNNERVTAKELAAHFGVSQRTIYRDVDTLSLAGIPVYSEQGKGGGIGLMPDFVLNKSILSEEEQNEILSALHGLSSVKTGETSQVLQKISAVFKKSPAKWLEVDFSEWSRPMGAMFSDLKAAITERRIVKFDYFSTYGEKTERQLEPVKLWFKSRSWYVKGYCLVREDLRLFKLSRIRNLRLTSRHFLERDLLQIQPKNDPASHQKQDITIKVRIAGEMAYRVYDELNEDSMEMQSDGSFVGYITWQEDEWVYSKILSFGEYIDVLEPEHLRKIIKEKAKNIAEKY
jgi:predicted DNA-binding transcriptional regulator YafY